MIFWIVVILMVIAIALRFIFDDWFEIWASISAFSFVVAAIMLIVLISNNDLGKRDLMEDIEAWNTDLAYRKQIQRNFWVGIFYPNIYDYFDFIELQ